VLLDGVFLSGFLRCFKETIFFLECTLLWIIAADMFSYREAYSDPHAPLCMTSTGIKVSVLCTKVVYRICSGCRFLCGADFGVLCANLTMRLVR